MSGAESSVLQKIATAVAQRLDARKAVVKIRELEIRCQSARRPGAFIEAFKASPAIIAEIKFKSPSEGALNARLTATEVARSYLANGAAALSILTEEDFFDGSYENLRRVRQEFNDAFILMKDFVIDEYQLYEALTIGADCVLLIVALLESGKLRALYDLASRLGLSVLVEVHDENEMDVALRLGAKLIGVNNRDLRTLKTSLDISRRLIKKATPEITLVCESGISLPSHIQEFATLGFKGFLVGTSLMRQDDPGRALKELVAQK